MDVDSKKNEDQERGHSANSIHTKLNEEEFEEFVEVASITDNSQSDNEELKCRFCWTNTADE